MTKSEIEIVSKQYRIKKYLVRTDLTVDIQGDLIISDLTLVSLNKNYPKFQFGRVSGNMVIKGNSLTTLIGCPKIVVGSFMCNDHQLTDLVGCPKWVGQIFDCRDNYLKTLDGIEYAPNLLCDDVSMLNAHNRSQTIKAILK